jgi:hypothetical protein
VKTMRMKGHAQHDPAEYVPKEMFEHWKARDPITLYEKYLTENKVWDAKKKSEIDARIERELDVEQKFAEESPSPPPELAERGVYCDGCHTIEADWKRPKEEVMPPKSSIEAAWTVEGFGGLEGEIPGAKEVAAAGNEGKRAAPLEKQAAKPAVKTAVVKAEPKTDVEESAALRVPFGRGPKDKAFVREARDNPRNNPRDKRRRR